MVGKEAWGEWAVLPLKVPTQATGMGRGRSGKFGDRLSRAINNERSADASPSSGLGGLRFSGRSCGVMAREAQGVQAGAGRRYGQQFSVCSWSVRHVIRQQRLRRRQAHPFRETAGAGVLQHRGCLLTMHAS